GGKVWDVDTSCGGGIVELHAGPSSAACQCSTNGSGNFTVRPCIGAAGDNGIGDSCTAASQTLNVDCTPTSLVVTIQGNGSVSSPSGITCPGDCTEYFASATLVTLTATPHNGETFNGW